MSSTIFRGRRRLQDLDTGELIETEVVERTVAGDTGWHKIWLGAVLELINEIGGQRMRVLLHLCSTADSQNQIYGSMRDIAAACGTSLPTVQRLMTVLQRADVITRRSVGVYRLNPDIVFRGGSQARLNVLMQYRRESRDNKADY